jgi:predicted 3-demethylubiquinone-9 3-methyltransferase (glyoxalase superfamily)
MGKTDITFIGINGGPQFPFSEAVSFAIGCKDQDEGVAAV